MKRQLLKLTWLRPLLIAVIALLTGATSVWGDETQTTLFHETFGENTGSARAWDDSCSVKSGVSAVYSGITSYTVTNAKQGKNTTGSTGSGLNQSTAGTDAVLIVGPLNVANYQSLSLTYQWKAASIKGTYSTSLYYATSATGDYTEVSGTGTGATTFVERSYNLPDAACVATLYLKIVWNTSNTQAIIDELDLKGVENTSGKEIPTLEVEGYTGPTFIMGSSMNLTITTNSDSEIKYKSEGMNQVGEYWASAINPTGFTQENGTATMTVYPNVVGTSTLTFSVEETETYAAKEVTLTFNVRKRLTQTEIVTTGITNTDVAEGTAAGSLLAQMKNETADGTYETYLTSSSHSDLFTWSSSNENAATVGSDGTVTLVGAGTTTITANFLGSQIFETSSATYELTVIDSNAPQPVTIWSEDFSGYEAGNVPSGGTYGYACSGSGTKVYDAVLAGGTTPELLVGKSGGTFTAVVPLNNASGNLTLTYKTNAKALSVSTTTEGITGSGSSNTAGEHTVTFTGVTSSMTSITIVFTATSSDNVRLDDIVLKGVQDAIAVEAPTFSVNGGTYYEAKTVELTCATAGATIYYSFDNETWTEYTEALTISETKTVYAKATLATGEESTVSSVTYTIAEKSNVVFNITDKAVAYGESYTITRGSGKDVETDGFVTVTSDNANVVSVDGLKLTAVAVGTATITLSAAEGNTYNAGETTITVTVAQPEGQTTAPAAVGATAMFDFTQEVDANVNEWDLPVSSTNKTTGTNTYTNGIYTITLDAPSSGGYYWKPGETNGGRYLLMGKSGATLTLPAFDQAVTQIDVEGTSVASEKVVQNIFVGETAVSTATTGAQNVTNEYTIADDYQAAGTIYTLKVTSDHNTQIKTITIHFAGGTPVTESYSLPSSGVGTYCSQYPINLSALPEGVKAYAVESQSETSVTLAEITTAVKGGTGFIIKGTGGTTITFSSVDSDNVPQVNKLIGTLAPTYVAANTVYGLKSGQFHPNNAGTIPAHKAYLPAESGSTGVKALTLIFKDADGITETRTITDAQTIYDLTGRRLQSTQKGVNIVNGRKVLVK